MIMADQTIHTIKVQLLQRGSNQVQTTVTEFEKQFNVSEKAFISTRVKQADNLKTISFDPVEAPLYLLIQGKHLVDNLSTGAKAGDLAPFTARVNGSVEDLDGSEGFLIAAGNYSGLQVSTSIEEDIEISIYIAG